MTRIDKFKPGVNKFWLYVIALAIWAGVGVYLNSLAVRWLRPVEFGSALLFTLGGILLAIANYMIMFKRFADQNIERISHLPGDKICVFAFQRWTSYPLVVVMISLGIFLRLYSPIPKPYLTILYIGIGTSLFLASLRYLRYVIHFRRPEPPSPNDGIHE